MKLIAISVSRYNGGVKAKRQFGSSTITKFLVFRKEDETYLDRSVYVETGGKTPGERATAAKRLAEPKILALLKEKGIQCPFETR